MTAPSPPSHPKTHFSSIPLPPPHHPLPLPPLLVTNASFDLANELQKSELQEQLDDTVELEEDDEEHVTLVLADWMVEHPADQLLSLFSSGTRR